MKLGILDAVPQKYYEGEGIITDTQRFVTLMDAVNFTGKIDSFHVAAREFPPSVDVCDAYLITGSPATAFEQEGWIDDLKALVRELYASKIPLVGVCFGHQVIAGALGGEVVQAPNGWMAGLYEHQLTETPAWVNGDLDTMKVYHLNRDQVVQLPVDATLIGQSNTCPFAMFHISAHVFSIQGHPEMPLDALRGYMVDLKDVLPEHVVERANQSVASNSPDDLTIATWIKKFVERDF